MHHVVFPWFSGFGNKGEGGGLKRSNKRLELSPRERAKVSSFLKFSLHKFFVDVTVVKRNGQLVKLEFYQSVVRLFVYHSSRR